VKTSESVEHAAGQSMLERVFRLTENKTCVWTEILAGVTTFVTMSYILFCKPEHPAVIIEEGECLTVFI